MRSKRLREFYVFVKKDSLRQLTLTPPSGREAKISLRCERVKMCVGFLDKMTASRQAFPLEKCGICRKRQATDEVLVFGFPITFIPRRFAATLITGLPELHPREKPFYKPTFIGKCRCFLLSICIFRTVGGRSSDRQIEFIS